ncbi:hypothetical protein CupriaWKF_01280 [Cupriavidus sp. WKF15]|uniref:hypothetical protein n=1 Tax=Cupriavidus sp. WKF15 TaxID=3032282 RepID=UPI0023E28C72|nr:hypothetical protein [Cupriavidus sp. WKF15]WER46252.1 hypothetical protein CupriaWKF_01280 [Cupriavidus sp. WKF15]
MKPYRMMQLTCAAMLALSAFTMARADTDRPRQTGVSCAHAGNTYCSAPQPAADAASQTARTGTRAED